MGKRYVIGIDAGGTKVAYGLFDQDGTIVYRMQHPTDADADGPTFSDTLIENVKAILEQNDLSFDQLDGVGICMPSFLFYDKGYVLQTSSMPGIREFPMRDYLQERLPVRIALDNDGNAAALAEYRRGAGRGTRHMMYIALGTGLGGGIIIDGKLFHGTYGWAGECGHMLVGVPDVGMACGCGNHGCYETHISGKRLPERVRLGTLDGIQSMLDPNTANGERLLEAYKAGDQLAVNLMDEMALYTAMCVFNIYQLLNINTFVFGGGLVNLGEPLFGRMRRAFDKLNHIAQPVYFKTAEFEKDFGIIGAAEFISELIEGRE